MERRVQGNANAPVVNTIQNTLQTKPSEVAAVQAKIGLGQVVADLGVAEITALDRLGHVGVWLNQRVARGAFPEGGLEGAASGSVHLTKILLVPLLVTTAETGEGGNVPLIMGKEEAAEAAEALLRLTLTQISLANRLFLLRVWEQRPLMVRAVEAWVRVVIRAAVRGIRAVSEPLLLIIAPL